jgi:hypothetical protein
MHKGDLVISDFNDHEYYRYYKSDIGGYGIIVGFTCNNKDYDCFYEALEGSFNLKFDELVQARVLWSRGIIVPELVSCLTVVSNENR